MRLTVTFSATLFALSGCSNGSPGNHVGPIDFTVAPRDAATADFSGLPPTADLSTPIDFAGSSDFARPPDLSRPPDLYMPGGCPGPCIAPFVCCVKSGVCYNPACLACCM